MPTPAVVDRDLALTVVDVRAEAEEVVSVRFETANGDVLPPWHPGAHLDVVLPSGKLRQYSLCGDPTDRGSYRIAVRRIIDGGGASAEIHDDLRPGSSVIARGPRNGFPFAYPHLARRDIDQVAFIAAGIGITAILPMVRAASTAGIDWRLTYVGRSETSMAFRHEVRSLDPRRVRVHAGPRLTADELLVDVTRSTAVYFCGPSAMLETVRAAVDDRDTAGFHFERFTPPPVVGGTPFDVRLRRSGKAVHVPPNESALTAVRGVLADVPYSCQQGFCGTCRVSVTSGGVERHGNASFLDEVDTMLLCSDRATTDHVEIDL